MNATWVGSYMRILLKAQRTATLATLAQHLIPGRMRGVSAQCDDVQKDSKRDVRYSATCTQLKQTHGVPDTHL